MNTNTSNQGPIELIRTIPLCLSDTFTYGNNKDVKDLRRILNKGNTGISTLISYTWGKHRQLFRIVCHDSAVLQQLNMNAWLYHVCPQPGSKGPRTYEIQYEIVPNIDPLNPDKLLRNLYVPESDDMEQHIYNAVSHVYQELKWRTPVDKFLESCHYLGRKDDKIVNYYIEAYNTIVFNEHLNDLSNTTDSVS